MKRTDLSYRDLRHTDLRYTEFSYLNLESSNLEGRVFCQKFRDIHARRANLMRTDFTGVDITDTIFDQCCLDWANLTKVQGSLVCFTRARLWNANLKQACLKESIFACATLLNSNLEEAVLEDCNFRFAQFTNTIFTNTRMLGTFLGDSNLRGVDVSSVIANHTDLGGDENSVIWDKETIWPKDMTGFVNIPTVLQQHLGL